VFLPSHLTLQYMTHLYRKCSISECGWDEAMQSIQLLFTSCLLCSSNSERKEKELNCPAPNSWFVGAAVFKGNYGGSLTNQSINFVFHISPPRDPPGAVIHQPCGPRCGCLVDALPPPIIIIDHMLFP
jgi:hypothetical protein